MTGAASLAQLVELTRKDLRVEARTGEALLVTAPFGAVALMFLPLAVGTDLPLLSQVGPGFYWVVVLLFGVLVTLRQSGVDGPAQRTLLRLSGVEPVVRVLARVVANAVLLLAFEAVLLPVMVVLYNPDLRDWPWLLSVMPLVAVGLAFLGALADGLSDSLQGRVTLGPLLVVPLAMPLLLGATQVLEAARYERPPWPWLLLVATVDLVVLLGTTLSAAALEEAG